MRTSSVIFWLATCSCTSSRGDSPESPGLATAGAPAVLGDGGHGSTGAAPSLAGAAPSLAGAASSLAGAGQSAGGVGGSTGGSSGSGGSAGSVNSSGGSTPTFPSVEGSLVLRLEHDFGVELSADKLDAWRDRSAKHNDALQGDPQFQPSIKALNGLMLPTFSGKANPKSTDGSGGPYLRIKDSDSLHWGTGDFAILVVVAYDNALDGTHNGGYGAFFGKSGKPELMFTGNWTRSETEEVSQLHLGLGAGAPGLDTKQEGFNDGKLRLLAAVRAGDRATVRANAVELGGVNGVGHQDVSAPKVDASIGSFSGTQALRCLRGQIAAVVALAGPQTNADLSRVETYLMSKYPLAPLP